MTERTKTPAARYNYLKKSLKVFHGKDGNGDTHCYLVFKAPLFTDTLYDDVDSLIDALSSHASK